MIKQPWLVKVEDALLDLFEFCETPEDQALIADLLTRTSHLSEKSFSAAIHKLAEQIEDIWKLEPEDTWFVSSNNKENTDSSQEVLNRLKAHPWKKLQWNRKQFFTRYRDVVKNVKNDDNIVIIDDFVGTGNSMLKTIKWFRDYFKTSGLKVNIKVCVVAGCMTGIEEIKLYGATIEYAHGITKAISEYYAEADAISALTIMNSLESKLSKSVKQGSFDSYRFGYGKSEAMYYRDGGNTPNNVFPIFWWRALKSGTRRTVMHRT